MKIDANRDYMMSLESVAMTDIVLNMFIFFFISFSILYTFNPGKAKHIKVNLPKAKNVVETKKQSFLMTVTLSGEGPVYLEGQVVTFEELEEKMAAAARQNPKLGVILEIDRAVAFKNVVRVLDVMNGLGIQQLRIAAQQEK